MIATPIFLVISIYLELTRLLEEGAPNAQDDLEERLDGEYAGLDWGDNAKIQEAMVVIEDDKKEEKYPQEKSR